MGFETGFDSSTGKEKGNTRFDFAASNREGYTYATPGEGDIKNHGIGAGTDSDP